MLASAPDTAPRARRRTRCCAPATATRLEPAAALRYAAAFKALADPTRLEILGLLAAAASALCACEIEAGFDLRQPTISHHLKVLRDAGLVTARRRGLWVYFDINREALDATMRLGEELSSTASSKERR